MTTFEKLVDNLWDHLEEHPAWAMIAIAVVVTLLAL